MFELQPSPLIYLFLLLPIAALSLLLRFWRLRNVPGPFLCRFTDLQRVYYQNRGQLLSWLEQNHQKYGTVLRIGPNTVSVSDATKVPSIYTMHGEFKKADSYHSLRAWVNGTSKGSIIDMQDEKLNADMKRSLRGAFSAKNVLEFDDEVDKQVLALRTRIREDRNIPLMEIMSQYQLDFFMKVAFGQTSHFLEHRIPTGQFSFMPRLTHWHRFQGLHKLEHMLFQTWFANVFSGERKSSAWMNYATSAIKGRMDCAKTGGKPDIERKDLLDKYIQARVTNPNLFDDEALLRMVSSTVSAGFDSTPFTMNNIIFYLCKYPEAYAKLKQEIMEVHSQGNLSEVPKWTEVNKLPYLDAVVKEAMRMKPFLNLPLEREVPVGGTVINGVHLPAHTTVGCHPGLVGRDRAIYGNDGQRFNPERWLNGDRLAMERNSLYFGSGKRMCLGFHIAELEIKKTIPVLVRDFNMKLVNANAELESEDGISSFPKSIMVQFEACH